MPVTDTGHRWREAMQLLDELIADEKNIIKNDEPMLVSYNAAIAACSRALKWWCALDLLYKMESR